MGKAGNDRAPRTADDRAGFDQRFYDDYEAVFRQLEARMPRSLGNGDERRLFTQVLMNRLMVLRFIEEKGWLKLNGGSTRLHKLLAATPPNASFYRTRLRGLFFGGPRSRGRAVGAIAEGPFSSGGLFGEGPLDRKVGDIPSAAFEPVLGTQDGLFYRYRFAIEESTQPDAPPAVTPEMLGTIFEELVTGRRESGAYYTPQPVVAFMCREVLKGYLADKAGISPEAVARLVDHREAPGLAAACARKLVEALDAVRAIDPACGSGAYLVGLLHEMVAIYRVLYGEKLPHEGRALRELKRRIIGNNLFGVDIDPFAARIAKLRLWLALAADSDEPPRFAGLECAIEAGDALLDPDPREPPRLARGLVLCQLSSHRCHGPTSSEDRATGLSTVLIEDSQGRGTATHQFTADRALGGGFDILLMNPPYVSANRLPGEKRNAFAAYMNKLRGVYGFKSDLYVHFFHRALQLLRPGGALAAITSSTYLTNTTKTSLRKHLLTRDIRWIIPLSPDVFAATVYSAICIVRNRPPAPDASIGFLNLRQADMPSLLDGRRALKAGQQVPAAEYRRAMACLFFEPTPSNRVLFSKLLSARDIVAVNGRRFVPLELVAPALDTGIHSGNIRGRLFHRTQPAGRRLPKLLQGRQILRYWSCWDSPAAKYRYVDVTYVPDENRKGIGRGGKPSGIGEYWHFCGPIENHHVTERLLMRQTEDEPFVGYLRQGRERIYTDNTLHTLLLTGRGRELGLSYPYLLAVLNSATVRRIYHALAQEGGRTLAQVKTTLVNRLPIPLPSAGEQRKLEGLVAKIRALYERNGVPLPPAADRRRAELQASLDKAVGRMYGLDGL